MNRRHMTLLVLAMLGGPAMLAAQSTGMPVFDAPYRAFVQHEFGATLSFPDPGGTALEGHYRFGYQKVDVGVRGGFWDPGDNADTHVLLGASGRGRVLTHNEDFPLDGAVVVGIGGSFVSGGANTLIIPAGLSLGRRLDVENSQVSIVPYAEPVMFLTSGGGNTDLNFAFGLGGDFRLSRVFDARVSVGLGDIEGVSISAVWVH